MGQNQVQNRVVLQGQLKTREPLRHTPAGVPVLCGLLTHDSEQPEAGHTRRISLEMPVVAIGPLALELDRFAPDAVLLLGGFLAHRSLRFRKTELHVTDIQLLQGIHHGIQTQG
jgi:primosomal replication protein N